MVVPLVSKGHNIQDTIVHVCVVTQFHAAQTAGCNTLLTLSPLNSFCLVVVVPERKRGLVAPQADLRPDWRRLQRGRGLTTERPRWPLTFSEDLTPEDGFKMKG